MKTCCNGKGWIRLPGTKALIHCPVCKEPNIELTKGSNVTAERKTGKVVSFTKKTATILLNGKPVVLDRSKLHHIYDNF